MDSSHEEQWMTLPLSDRAASPDIEPSVPTWYEPEPILEPSLQWFMDLSRYLFSLEDPTTPSIPWIMDSAGLKSPPEPCMSPLFETSILEDLSNPPTPSSSRTREAPTGPRFGDEPNLSRRRSSSPYGVSLPELLADYTTSSDSIFLSRAKCPFKDANQQRVLRPLETLRHYRQHFKRFFYHYGNCSQSTLDPHNPNKRGFATCKD
ncbi:uncharacterized protein BDW43DRAFT_308673 [Aspergillus alliaceus]|uniref:uncharacterized protein n=1 Tax=Petromyces alliaceus TaxID=209559 RepID=UPI0012A4B5B6|nr:uncharacterized protein BDW43DRAFT_308673 [Aspergillus alliaceus]KAB8235862.1 hypothetical protein BDW43DRAFT_308673 [Aspergillus alliaceus]